MNYYNFTYNGKTAIIYMQNLNSVKDVIDYLRKHNADLMSEDEYNEIIHLPLEKIVTNVTDNINIISDVMNITHEDMLSTYYTYSYNIEDICILYNVSEHKDHYRIILDSEHYIISDNMFNIFDHVYDTFLKRKVLKMPKNDSISLPYSIYTQYRSLLIQKTAEIGDSFCYEVTKIVNDIKNLLLEKNKNYGNAALNPKRIFSTNNSIEQICVRIDDKLSRISNMGINNLGNEDTINDLIGYLIILKIKLNENISR